MTPSRRVNFHFTCSLIFFHLFHLIAGSQLSKDVTSCNVTEMEHLPRAKVLIRKNQMLRNIGG